MAGLFIIFFSEFAAALSLGGLNNMAVKVGDQVTMACDLESNGTVIDWHHASVLSNGKALPVKRINAGPEFSLDQQTLRLNSTQMKHAGIYRCSAKGNSLNAQLIVFESEPICNLTFNQTHFDIRCEVLYNGYWIPTMQLLKMTTQDENLNLAAESVCENNSTNNNNNLTTLTFSDSISSLRSVDRYVFRMIFLRGYCKRAKTNATDAPNYNFSRVFRTAELFEFPKSISSKERSYTTIEGESEIVALPAPYITYASVGVVAVSAVLVFTVVIWKKRKRKNHHILGTSGQDVDDSVNALPMTPLKSTDASDQTDDQLTSPEPTSIEGHDGTKGDCGTYENIDLNTATALSTSVLGTLHFGDSSSGKGSVGKISDSSSDSNSSKKRNNNYEELLERSPVVKHIYMPLKGLQKEEETQKINSSNSCNENVTESPLYINSESALYVNSLQANTAK